MLLQILKKSPDIRLVERLFVPFRVALVSVFFAIPAVVVASFEENVLSIFEEKCFTCHSAKVDKPKAGLRFDSAADLVRVAGDPGWERVLEVVSLPQKDEDHMPPADKAEALTDAEIDALRAWVEKGSPVGSFTAFEHEPEAIVSGLGKRKLSIEVAEAAAEIDALVAKRLGDTPREPAVDDATFLRRTFLTLIGRNPLAAEARAFLDNKAADKRARLIDGLIGSRGYLSHHFNYWADVFRVQSDQKGNLNDSWIAYLKRSIDENVPYDEWVHELLTAEGRMWESPAIAFRLRDGKNRLAGYEANVAVFMGLEIGCAQCHDHPFEPLSQLDYYQMWGYFVGAHPYGGRDDAYLHLDGKEVRRKVGEVNDRNKQARVAYNSRERDLWLTAYLTQDRALETKLTSKDGTMMSRVPKTYRYDDFSHGNYLDPKPIYGTAPPLAKEGEKPAEVFADWLVSPDNLRFTHVIANRIWAQVFGRPLLGSLTNAAWADESDFPELAEHLAELMVACDYDLRRFQRILLSTRTWQSEAVAEDMAGDDFAFSGPVLQRLSAEQVWDSLVTLIDPDPDAAVTISEPDFSFPHQLRGAKSMDEFWSLIEAHVDRIREKTGKSVGDRYFKPSRDMRTLAKNGYLEGQVVRASEIRSPALPGHFLRVFGQGEREMTEDAWRNPTIPQSLMLLNGGLGDELAAEDSALSRDLARADTEEGKLASVYLSVLGRRPTSEEAATALAAVLDDETTSWHDLAWALLNTTEFLFVP